MKYKITNIKVKENAYQGKSVADLDVIDISGAPFKGSMWSDFPNFSTMTFGIEFEADMVTKDKNGYPSSTFYPIRPKPTSGGANRGSQMTKVMETKDANVTKHMDRKEGSIQIAASQRDATLWVTTFYEGKGWDDEELKTKWNEMKKFFMDSFDQPF